MNGRRYFTWEEATALLPRLQEIFSVAGQVRTRLRTLYEQLESLGAAPTPETLNQPGPPAVMRLRGQFRGLYETLTDELKEIEELGAFVKDIDMGLVDFLYRREGRDVFLCWRYGETEINYWHDISEGFGGRRPLEPSDRVPQKTTH